MTTAVGHGKKAARNIDAFLRGENYVQPPKDPIVPFEVLNLPVFLDAGAPAKPRNCRSTRAQAVSRRSHGGLTEPEARYEAKPLPVLRQLFRMRQLLRGLSRAGDR